MIRNGHFVHYSDAFHYSGVRYSGVSLYFSCSTIEYCRPINSDWFGILSTLILSSIDGRTYQRRYLDWRVQWLLGISTFEVHSRKPHFYVQSKIQLLNVMWLTHYIFWHKSRKYNIPAKVCSKVGCHFFEKWTNSQTPSLSSGKYTDGIRPSEDEECE